jgi:hypothetical protein
MTRTIRLTAAIAASVAAPTLADVGDGVCDGERPSFQADEYLAFGGGQVAAATQFRASDAQGVVNVYDLSGQSVAPLGTDWGTPLYSDPRWVRSELGQVFGVALDDIGNIFVSHTAVYGQDAVGALGGQPGQIYKIDAVTGTPTVFATLPNNSDPAIAASIWGVNESYPGLGNICFDVDKQVLYATNFEDGRIYRIDATGACLSTWDHATGTLEDCTPDADDNPGVVPHGERVWAVQSFNGRVYYSVWVEDLDVNSPSTFNEVWSVACDPSGEFISGTEQLEIAVPQLFLDYSNPVADIAFGPEGQMMLAERTMNTDLDEGGRFNTAAHQSRALEYICDEQRRWVPSGNDFDIGSGGGNNSAGGCDYSYAASPDDRVWVTGDALILSNPGTGPNVYGIQGLPQTGGAVPNSILIDMDEDIIQQDKRGLGSVEISCPRAEQDPCATITNEEILCDLDDSGNFTVTFDLTNNSGRDVAYLLILPDPGFDVVPTGVIALPSILPDGGTTSVDITFMGGMPGDEFCFLMSLNTVNFEECCTIRHCVTVPDCDCAQIHDQTVKCAADGSGCFDFFFEVDNLTSDDIYYSFLVPTTPGVTLDTGNTDPSRWDFIPVLLPNNTAPMSVNICGGAPGTEVCFILTLHNQSLDECCSIEVCVEVPDCEPQGNPCPADCNGDGVLDFFDITMFLGDLAATQPRADLNNDSAWDFFDVSNFLTLFQQGCP